MKRLRTGGNKTAIGRYFLSAAVLLCVGLTVFFTCFREKDGENPRELSDSRCTIVRESLAGREEIPLEEYLIGALAVSVPDDYASEACKAQAVVLRSNVWRLMQECGSSRIRYEELHQESLMMRELYQKWGEDFAENYEKFKKAVSDTKGQSVVYEGIAVALPFFPVSAGATRNGADVLQTGNCPYLRPVPCEEDRYAAEYEQEICIREKEMNRALQELFGAESEVYWKDVTFARDDGGYVTEVIWNDARVSGEAFREALSLASACFTITEQEGRLYIVTKGVGHGLGMSLYCAGKMAENGTDYREIIRYFFPDCEIIKN